MRSSTQLSVGADLVKDRHHRLRAWFALGRLFRTLKECRNPDVMARRFSETFSDDGRLLEFNAKAEMNEWMKET